MIAALTGFSGRRRGYQDAFRHTYASAVVARYFSPRAVFFVTKIMESKSKHSIHNLMDIHNNTLGVEIGLSKEGIYKTVYEKVNHGVEFNSDKTGVYILPMKMWSDGF